MPVDPSAVETLGAFGAAGWIGKQILGPTLSEVGFQLKDRYTARGEHNVERAVERAIAKAADRTWTSSISARLGVLTFDQAALSEDQLLSDYLGGVLAASCTGDGSDDAGLPTVHLLSQLSSQQIRLHFLIYSAARELIIGRCHNPCDATELAHTSRIAFRLDEVTTALAYDGSTPRPIEATRGLYRESLLGFWASGDANHVYVRVIGQDEPGSVGRTYPRSNPLDNDFDWLMVTLSDAGIELYQWGMGENDSDGELTRFIDPEWKPVQLDDVPLLRSGQILQT